MSEWKKQRDLLVEEALAFSQRVAVYTTAVPPETKDPRTFELKSVAAEDSAPTEKPNRERAVLQNRLRSFKAHQDRFQREREEYYATTMAKARATPWNSPDSTT
jgi:hypothetical protein